MIAHSVSFALESKISAAVEAAPNEHHMQPCENRIVYGNCCYFSFILFAFDAVKC